jgi:hypothetical protein
MSAQWPMVTVTQEVTTPYILTEQLILYPRILFEIKNLICKQLVFEDKTQEETLQNHQITSYLSYTETKNIIFPNYACSNNNNNDNNNNSNNNNNNNNTYH